MKVSRNTLRIVLYASIYLLPILGMINCHGWNEGTGVVQACYIDFSFARVYAEFYYMLALASAFLLLIPLVVYILLGVLLTEIIVRVSIRQKA